MLKRGCWTGELGREREWLLYCQVVPFGFERLCLLDLKGHAICEWPPSHQLLWFGFFGVFVWVMFIFAFFDLACI